MKKLLYAISFATLYALSMNTGSDDVSMSLSQTSEDMASLMDTIQQLQSPDADSMEAVLANAPVASVEHAAPVCQPSEDMAQLVQLLQSQKDIQAQIDALLEKIKNSISPAPSLSTPEESATDEDSAPATSSSDDSDEDASQTEDVAMTDSDDSLEK